MPSRSIATSAPSPSPEKLCTVSSLTPAPLVSKGYEDGHTVRTTRVFNPLMAAGAGVGFSFFITLSVCFCKFSRKRSSPTPGDASSSPRRFSYSTLRRATASFSPNNRLGQGGFGAVFRGSVSPLNSSGSQNIAVKLMDSGSLQGEREFQNELFFAAKLDSPHVVPVLGFSQDRKRRRLLLVYELMDNGNLQDALLHRRCPELMEWNQRFLVAINIAEGIEHLHNLEPPVIHGDIKPSNVLLDKLFSAKISDFGLARLKSDQVEIIVAPESNGTKLQSNGGEGGAEDNGSVVEEVESVVTNTTGYEEFNFGFVDQSPGSISASPETALAPMTSPETTTTTAVSVSPELGEKADVLDDIVRRNGKEMENIGSKDWWWKQESNGERGKVKDYVMQWIGSEVSKERPSSDWTEAITSSTSSKKLEKKSSKRLEWWLSLEEEKEKEKKKKKKKMVREWWKDEYRRELAKKKKEKKKNTLESEFYSEDGSSSVNHHQWRHGDEELYTERRRNRKKRSGSSSNNSKSSSIDWWLDGLSGERWRTKGNNNNNNNESSVSGEIAKSCGVSSTPSMRGTVCYAAPEFCNLENVSEKCDVYSYGVLLLVLVSGRRPLEMTGSATEIQRANLMSWARRLARRGKLVDLIDEKLQTLDQEQALLCIKVALQCLQRAPAARPSMKEVVGMLRGEVSPPEFPNWICRVQPFGTVPAVVDGGYKIFEFDSLSARKLFDEMSERDVVSWSVVIRSYVQNQEAVLGLKLFKEMVHEAKTEPDSITVTSVLKACTVLEDIDVGRSVHGFAIVRGFDLVDVFVRNSLIDAGGSKVGWSTKE